MPPRWLAHQQFAFAATCHSQKDNWGQSDQDRLFGFLWEDSLVPEGNALRGYCGMLETLPPAVLELICSLTDRQVDYWAEHQTLWEKVRQQLEWDKGLRRSRWAGAKLVADRVASGLFEPSQIARLFRTELRTEADLLKGFDEPLRALTAAFATARNGYDRLEAIHAFSEHRPPALWALVENVILQGSLSWPLLVMDGEVGCALPALITVFLPDEPDRETPPGDQVTVIDGDHTDGQDWKSSLAKARTAAIELWEAKHACEDAAVQHSVRNARVVLDLRLASRVVEKACAGGKFELSGPSLETYIGLEVLNQLLGAGSLGSTCATGEIGDRFENGAGYSREAKGAFYGVNSVDGLGTKVEWVRRAFHFDKAIIPLDNIPSGSRDHLELIAVDGQIDSITYKYSDLGFSGYATQALGQRWRRHRYMRCPDVAARFKEEKRLHRPTPDVAKLLSVISNTQVPRVWANGYEPATVAHALYWVNDNAQKSSNPEFAAYSGSERIGRFAFVRAVAEESAERFWAVVWEACGGTPSSFRRFVLAPNLRAAAEQVADLLNGVASSSGRRAAAPDVLVVFATKHLTRDGPRPMKNDPFARFRLDFLVDELVDAELLQPCGNKALRAFLGSTRLILVPGDAPPVDDLFELLGEPLGEAMERLSVFRNGFTFAMAKIMLGLDHGECQGLLSELRRIGLLVFAENAQESFLLAKAPLPEDRRRCALLHLDAANAIVGILSRTRRPAHHDFSSALRPHWLHEAQWHAEHAYMLDSQADARERLARIGEPFTWSQLRWAAIHAIHPGEDMWRGGLAAGDEAGRDTLHPAQLAALARFARAMEKQKHGASSSRWETERTKLLEEALQACGTLQEGDALAAEFVVRSTRAGILMDSLAGEEGYAAASDDVKRAWELYEAFEESEADGAIEILDPRWLEWCGDAEKRHSLSIGRYRAAFLNPRIRGAHRLSIPVLVKWLGCRQLASDKLSLSEWQALGKRLRPEHLEEIRLTPRATPEIAATRYAALRWKVGREKLLSNMRF